MSKIEQFNYDNSIVNKFTIASLVFGVVGMSVGLWIASALVWPEVNLNLPWTTFGRLRPLHTNAVVFAFVGNATFAGVYYSLQRLLKTRMASDLLSNINFWGWQLIIVAVAVTYPLGLIGPHEYAEAEWPIDIGIALIWVVFGLNMMLTIWKRRESHLYVAIWFYIATFVTVTVLHIGNNLELPVSAMKSYPVFAGVQDALIQWWYGHNAVAFFLTTPFLGLMYYFMPKAANRPVYSYKLSIIHFWSLIFLYIWAGPHHLLYTSLPDWVQSLGTVFSLMLIAPSWGGMLNGLLTLRGAWDRVAKDPILKFMVVAVTAYGMSTFEGPMMSIKSVNAITHYTDWTIAHVHIGALGWNGMLAFGMFYWMIPRIFGTKLFSVSAANTHFWLSTLGIILYAVPLYWGGVTQQLMWKEFAPDGSLVYGNFLDTVTQIIPMYFIRIIGGTTYFVGVCLGIWNLMKTAGTGKLIKNEAAEAPAREVYTGHQTTHRKIEGNNVWMHLLVLLAIIIGGLIEIVPMVLIDDNVPKISTVTPYTPLELEGRDIYIREGCMACHSQMIRPFRSETERYGEFSKAGEFIYDRPMLFGSKRTGPDLHRIGGKYNHAWHYNHMDDPRSTSPGSIMPRYSWLFKNDLDYSNIDGKIRGLQMLGTPYPEGFDTQAAASLEKQANEIAKGLRESGIKQEGVAKKEITAVIAYLQRLGTDIKK